MKVICGVDVSSKTLDARIGRDGASLRVDRSPEGIGQLAQFCRQHHVELVVMEATGGYEKLPFALLWQAGLPCAVVNPRCVRQFAQAMGLLEKTDRLDAGVIAWYAETKRLVGQPPASANQQRLTALVRHLHKLTNLVVAQGNLRRLQAEADILQAIDAVIALARTQIRQFERDIAALLADDPLWRQLDACFREIKGVADRVVARLAAELPEIGTISNKAAAKLVGLAPMAQDSGEFSGRRRVRGGRAGLRSILYVVVTCVRQHNPDFADFHQRLTEAGLPKKAIRIALARKLLVRLNAKARDARNELQLAA